MQKTAEIFDIRHHIADSQAKGCRDLLSHVADVENLIMGFEVWAEATAKLPQVSTDSEMSASLLKAVGLLTAGRVAIKTAANEIEAASHRPFIRMFWSDRIEFDPDELPPLDGFAS